MSGLGPNLVFPSSGLDGWDVLVKSQKDRKSCWYSNVINHPFLMVNIPPIKMVMNGGWFIIAIPTLMITIKKMMNPNVNSPATIEFETTVP